MKKTMLVLAAVAIAAAANAKILRVSNVTGSSAPYATIEAAHDAANSGDTIMVDASNVAYFEGSYTMTKSIVLIGPGYWLVENGVIEEGASSAMLSALHLKGEGSVIKGFNISHLYIEAPKVVVERCSTGAVTFSKGADNCIVHQNFITGGITTSGGTTSRTSYHQITNNIFTSSNTGSNLVGSLTHCFFGYNTFRTSQLYVGNIYNTTFEYNIVQAMKDAGDGNSFSNNYETSVVNTQSTSDFIDSDYLNKIELPADVMSKYGAFAGDSPYVLAGVPSGPVIQDLIVPTSVEMGSKMNVTIKIGMQK